MSFVNKRTIFFQNLKLRNGMASSQKNEQRFFKLASVKSVKTACVCIVCCCYCFLFFFFIISNIMVKTFFKNNGVLLVAKVERKE